jgi:hypothetical protein
VKTDYFHPFEQVASFVVSGAAKGDQELVGTKVDVVAHHGLVNSNEFDREGINNKIHLDVDCTPDIIKNVCFREMASQFGVE